MNQSINQSISQSGRRVSWKKRSHLLLLLPSRTKNVFVSKTLALRSIRAATAYTHDKHE